MEQTNRQKRQLTNDIINRPIDRTIIAREFIPNSKKPFFTLFRIHIFSILIILPLIYLHGETKPDSVPSVIVNTAFGLSLITAVVTRFVAIFSFESLNGHFGGKLIFNKKGIELNEKFYDFNDIQDISISLNYYYKESRSGISAHAALSHGVDNKLSFRMSGLYNYSCFQVSSKEQLLGLIAYLKSLDDSIKISFSYKDELIRVQDFDPKLYRLL